MFIRHRGRTGEQQQQQQRRDADTFKTYAALGDKAWTAGARIGMGTRMTRIKGE
jgi:hypothetical protein